MRKVYVFQMLSLDGYFEGPDHDLSWHNVDDEFNKFAVQMLQNADLFIYGRRTYQLMESFWPNAAKEPEISEENIEIAKRLNNTPKLVISTTLDKVEEKENWKNVSLVNKFDPEQIRKLKKAKGKDIWVGGSKLAESFVREGLVDEFRFMINPVVIGKGTPILGGLGEKLKLKLVGARKFESGNVLLTYRP